MAAERTCVVMLVMKNGVSKGILGKYTPDLQLFMFETHFLSVFSPPPLHQKKLNMLLPRTFTVCRRYLNQEFGRALQQASRVRGRLRGHLVADTHLL